MQVQSEKGEKITQLRWSTDDQGVIWAVTGNSLSMWDLYESKIKWVHAGHMQDINQIDVHPTEPNSLVSVDNNNEIHVFQPTRNVTF